MKSLILSTIIAIFLGFNLASKGQVTTTNNKVSRSLATIKSVSNFPPLPKSIINNTNSRVIVAVIDSGIDYTHELLMHNIWVNTKEIGPWTPPSGFEELTDCRDKSCNGIDDDGNGYVDDVAGWDFVNNSPLPYDVHGHGTHIAGIIGAQPSSHFKGGIAPDITIMPLKYISDGPSDINNLRNLIRAIRYATKMGATIINYSGGGKFSDLSEFSAIKEAQEAGILFVAAAGNEGKNNSEEPYFPASYSLDNIISVAALNGPTLLPISNYGELVHVAAQGLSVLSTLPLIKYGTMTGTSQATAHVSGIAAKLFLNQTKFDYKEVRQKIFMSAIPMLSSKKVRYGIITMPK